MAIKYQITNKTGAGNIVMHPETDATVVNIIDENDITTERETNVASLLNAVSLKLNGKLKKDFSNYNLAQTLGDEDLIVIRSSINNYSIKGSTLKELINSGSSTYYKGEFKSLSALKQAYPSGNSGEYAFVNEEDENYIKYHYLLNSNDLRINFSQRLEKPYNKSIFVYKSQLLSATLNVVADNTETVLKLEISNSIDDTTYIYYESWENEQGIIIDISEESLSKINEYTFEKQYLVYLDKDVYPLAFSKEVLESKMVQYVWDSDISDWVSIGSGKYVTMVTFDDFQSIINERLANIEETKTDKSSLNNYYTKEETDDLLPKTIDLTSLELAFGETYNFPDGVTYEDFQNANAILINSESTTLILPKIVESTEGDMTMISFMVNMSGTSKVAFIVIKESEQIVLTKSDESNVSEFLYYDNHDIHIIGTKGEGNYYNYNLKNLKIKLNGINHDTFTEDGANREIDLDDTLTNYIKTGTQTERSIYASYMSMTWYANNYESGLTLKEGNTGLFGGGSSIYLRDNDISINGNSFNELYSKVQELYGNYITFSIDNSINYTKTVPTNAEQYATVNKVGGMSYKTTNLIVIDDVAETEKNGITYKVENGVITINGTTTSAFGINLPLIYSIPTGTYTLNRFGDKGTDGSVFGICYSNAWEMGVQIAFNNDVTYKTATIKNEGTYLRLYLNSNGTYSNYKLKPILVSGSTVPNKWENGFKGLRNAVTNKVKVIGVNLLGGMQFLGNGYINGNTGEITNTTSAKMYDYFPVGSNTKILIKIGNYTSLTNAYACRIGEYDINKTFIKNTVIASSSHIITFDGATKYIRLSIDAKATSIMLSFDTTLTEYVEPKYNVLPINAIVTDINQSNLMENTTFELGQINDDGTLSGTSSGEGYSGRTIQYMIVKPSTSYIYKDTRTLTTAQNTIMYIVEYDSAKNFIQKKLHQKALNNMLYTTTFTTTERTAYVKFGYIFEYTLTNAPINCVLVEGTDLTKVSYYGLGVNANCYNYIDLDNNKYIQRVASYTFTSSDTVLQIDTNTTGIYRYMFSGLKGIIKSCASNVIANIVMENLESITVDHTYQPTSEGIGVGPNGDLIFYKSNIQTTADAKEFLVGKTIIYELAEPIITSLTYEYDNIIEVEPNGTIIFENEYQYDVPSEIEYQVKAGN